MIVLLPLSRPGFVTGFRRLLRRTSTRIECASEEKMKKNDFTAEAPDVPSQPDTVRLQNETGQRLRVSEGGHQRPVLQGREGDDRLSRRT